MWYKIEKICLPCVDFSVCLILSMNQVMWGLVLNAVVTIHSFKFTVFFRIDDPARRYHSFQFNYQLWYLLGCSHVFFRRLSLLFETSFTAIHFFYGTAIIHRNILSNPVCQGHCFYFKWLIAAIHYIKRIGFTFLVVIWVWLWFLTDIL